MRGPECREGRGAAEGPERSETDGDVGLGAVTRRAERRPEGSAEVAAGRGGR